jgi:hypothetical protein
MRIYSGLFGINRLNNVSIWDQPIMGTPFSKSFEPLQVGQGKLESSRICVHAWASINSCTIRTLSQKSGLSL